MCSGRFLAGVGVALLIARGGIAGAAEFNPAAEPVRAPAYVVTATRDSQSAQNIALPLDLFGSVELIESPATTLDGALKASPAFSLFRRTDSLTAHPTAQGVSLRGLGPSGASRSLVLLDGVPLNDPFGGWVTWSKVPRLSLQGVEIVHGGGSGTWGSGALAGAVQALTAAPGTGRNALHAGLGAHGTRFVEVSQSFRATADAANTAHAFRVGGRWFETDGFFQYAPTQRGAIDRPLDSRHALATVDYQHALPAGGELRLGVRGFDEERGNGTPFQRNDSREFAAHASLALQPTFSDQLELVAYGQRQRFASGFSAVDATRATETPSLDQFEVPATAWGAALLSHWRGADGATTIAGADARKVSGETREDFLFSAGEFQRRRFAGGDQLLAGAFVERVQPLSLNGGAPQLTLTGAARLDFWRQSDGHRREIVRETGTVVRDDRFNSRDGWQFSPSLGVVYRQSEHTKLRAAVYRAFRVPTLNELYRPFRVGNVATEANPALALETLAGWDIGVETQTGPWRLSLGWFDNRLHDAVTNVTLSSTPALTQRQRLNVDALRVQGAELAVGWLASEQFTLNLNYLFSHATVRSAAVAPDLVGKRLPQVPRHTATLQAVWRPTASWRVSGSARAMSDQFEDDDNELVLASAIVADVAIAWAFQPNREISLSVENVFDEKVESTRTAAGLVSLGPPRYLRAALLMQW